MRAVHDVRVLGALVVAVGVMLAGACGSHDDDDDGGAQGAASGAGETAAVQVVDAGTLGPALADSRGMTLYVFTEDTPGSGKSSCNGACLQAWPALVTTLAAAPAVDGASGDFGIATRDDGSRQITYRGYPLYRFSGDQKPGDTTGQGAGGVWFVATLGLQGVGPAPAAAGDTPGTDGYGY